MIKCALEYASKGFRVFPIKKGTKGGQLLKSWKEEATTEEATIKMWWTKWPDADICIATGNGLLVIDLDVKAEEDGTETLFKWISDNGKFPKTAVVKTKNGGQHHYYKINGEYANKRGFMPGIDIRSDGGYVVAPPSTGYEWVDDTPIADADQAVYDFLDKKESNGLFNLPAEIVEGGRNDTLFRFAASLQAKGIADEEIITLVHKANHERCVPALPEKDVDTIIRSVIDRYQKGFAGMPDFPDIKYNKDGSRRIPVTAANTAAMLQHEGYEVYFDVIRRENVIKRVGEIVTGIPQIKYESILTHLTDQYTRYGARTGNSRMHEHISQIADINRFNAAKDYLESNYLLYGSEKGIESLIDALNIGPNDLLSRTLIRKWLCQCVAMAHNEQGEYGAEGILVLKGPQGIGKTTFFRKCCCIGLQYFTEGAIFDGTKDKVMANTSAWITELGELPRSMKDSDSMKAFITSATDKYRIPYDKKEAAHPRLTSFGATTNEETFLKDDVNRRYWVISLNSICLDKLNKVCFEDVWAEAYEDYRLHGQHSFRLTKDEREQMDAMNKAFRVESEEERLLLDLFDWNQPKEEWKEYTATQIAEKIGHNVSSVKVGKVLNKSTVGSGVTNRIKDGRTLYLLPRRKTYDFEGI